MAEYTLTPTQSEQIVVVDRGAGETELCGTEMTDGSTCERPAADCPYHQED